MRSRLPQPLVGSLKLLYESPSRTERKNEAGRRTMIGFEWKMSPSRAGREAQLEGESTRVPSVTPVPKKQPPAAQTLGPCMPWNRWAAPSPTDKQLRSQ